MDYVFNHIPGFLISSVMELDLTGIIFLLITMLASVGLIIIIYSRSRESIQNRLFILLLVLVIGYLISHATHFLIMHSENVTILDNSCHSFLLMIIVTITFFTWNFPEPRKIGVIRSLLVIIPSVVMLGLLWTGFFIEESHAHQHMFLVKYSSAYPVLLIWYAFLIALNFYWLINKYSKEESQARRKQILLLFLGLIITNLASFIFGMFLPWYLGFYYLVEISPLSFLAGVILFTTIAVSRYDMFRSSMERIHNFSISKKIIFSALILVPIIILLVQVPLIRIIFEPGSNRELFRYFLISVFGGILVSIIIAFVIVKIISNPLKAFRHKASEIEKGSYGTRISLSSNDEFGELTKAFNKMSDTLKSNSSELKKKEERISLLLNAFEESSAAIAIVSDDFRIIEANQQFCSIVAADRNDILNKSLESIQFNGALGEDFDIIKNELQLYSRFRGELKYDDKTLLVYVTPSSAGNRFSGYLFIEVDITEQKKLEEQLLKSEKLAALGKMAAVLAHEIKTPLTSIKMNADIIAEDLKVSNTDKESLRIIQTEINRLNNLVKDVLQFSRQMELDYSEFDLFDLIEKIRNQLSTKLKAKNISLINEAGHIHIKADEHKLTQVFINLFENSIDAIGRDGVIRFTSETINKDETVNIKITDTGSGIGSDVKVFEPFFTTKASGTGLGLSVAQKIVEQHRGKINLVSPDPGETVFSISLPVNRTDNKETENSSKVIQ